MATSNSALPTVDQLLVALARTSYWAIQYGPVHPATRRHIRSLHSYISAHLATEPGNCLLLGVARNKFYYRDRSVGMGNEIVRTMTEQLYSIGVATINFGPKLAHNELAEFFKFLYQDCQKEPNETFDQYLKRVCVTGIQINKYNYKELLSRKTGEASGIRIDPADREDFLLKSLIFSHKRHDDETEQMLIDNIVNYPELLRAIVVRSDVLGARGEPEKDDDAAPGPRETISPEVLGRLLQRLGETMKSLPLDRKESIIRYLESGLEREKDNLPGSESPLNLFVAKSLTEELSSDDFMDLMGMVLSAEDKTSSRFRNSFRVLAEKRNTDGALLTALSERMEESQKAKDYYAVRTWEAMESLLLSRADDAYIDGDHANFLEYISSLDFKHGNHASGTVEPYLVNSLAREEQHKKIALILLELLGAEQREEVFYDLIEEIRKLIPNLISRKEISLLETVLFRLSDLSAEVSAVQGKILRDIIVKVDYDHLLDYSLHNPLPPETANTIVSILARFASVTTPTVLDRLLSESDRSRRKVLMKLIASLGTDAVPALVGRLSHPKWYFVRNICTALGDIGDAKAIPGLMTTIAHEDWRVRREAIAALGKLGSRDPVPVLGNILTADRFFSSQEDESVRLAAATALCRIGGKTAFSFLEKGSYSRRPAVREFCTHLSKISRRPS